MKKLLLSILLSGLATGVYAQGAGTILLANNNNANTSPTATANGLVFIDTGGGPTLITTDFNVALFGFTDSASVLAHPVASLTGANTANDNVFGPGTFTDLSSTPWPVDGTTTASTTGAFFILQGWIGAFSSYNQALLNGVSAGQTIAFLNPLGNTGEPPSLTPQLQNMPALILSVPEPSTFALAGLGAAALLMFRRRK